MGPNASKPIVHAIFPKHDSSMESSHDVEDKKTKVLIVDDHPLYCEGMRALLESGATGFQVVGQAWTSSNALLLAREHQPDIVLLDVELDHGAVSGLDLISQLRRLAPAVRIVIVTGHSEREYLMSAMKLGVHAYLEKDLSPLTLLNAIQQVRDGERVLANPKDLTLVLTELSDIVQERERARSDLMDQEVEMLRLAAAGYNNKEIGQRMYWSEITVKRKMQAVYHKLSVGSRAQAVAAVIRLGFM